MFGKRARRLALALALPRKRRKGRARVLCDLLQFVDLKTRTQFSPRRSRTLPPLRRLGVISVGGTRTGHRELSAADEGAPYPDRAGAGAVEERERETLNGCHLPSGIKLS